MCGIVAVLRQRATRDAPAPGSVLALVERAVAGLDPLGGAEHLLDALNAAAAALEEADALLRGVPGVRCLLGDRALLTAADRFIDRVWEATTEAERILDEAAADADTRAVEERNAALIRLKDAAWALQRDRLRTARAVDDLAGPDPTEAAVEAYTSIQIALSALDRLEVRGRDSAGLHVLVHGHDLDLSSPAVAALLSGRTSDPSLPSGAVRAPSGHLSFVYKAAAEIGELGDNTKALREAVRGDPLLRLAVSGAAAEAVVLAHTRWASVGIISEANAHPVDSDEIGRDGPYVVAALNGDVDNFADLKAAEGLRIVPDVTTDAKVIPTLVSRRLATGAAPEDAFRATVASFEGSVAIAAAAADHPRTLLLAQRGSGQALYVGLAEDAFIVASEPYGLVEETSRFMRLDGETPANPDNPTGSRGQVVVLDGTRPGTLDGIRRLSYDGTDLALSEDEVQAAQVTTRDIDRGDHPHFLLKEIGEAPSSFRKTLRGKLVEREGRLGIQLGPETVPAAVVDGLRRGRIDRIVAIGQGTAAVAAHSFATVLAELSADTNLAISALPATELSGFGLRQDMSDTLVVAISQSGTTTDTNRTVDLARSRGATVIGIVNRRNSDLTDKADGVLYTSDGRDVEMSVPSTKAFYAQVAAGVVLAWRVAELAGADLRSKLDLLDALRALPDQMARIVADRGRIGDLVRGLAPVLARRYWAVVGNGTNRIAAMELRIKLSELCYKSIAYDVTEDKKHIDLSAEPMILVCAAGLSGSNADDVAKEVAIYRAHQAVPVVIASEGESRFTAAAQAIYVPTTHPDLAFVLAAMAGHLFGYEAALAIDGLARPLREARVAIEQSVADAVSAAAGDGAELLRRLRFEFEPAAARYFDTLRAGCYDGTLEASTAVRLSSLFRYALGTTPLDGYQVEHGKIGTPGVVVEDLAAALTQAIEQLTRPIDAIKHQAKTVTVGISRTDETLLQVPLVQDVLRIGAPRDRLTYRTLRTLAALAPAIAEVTGWIRYQIDGDPDEREVPAAVVERGGIAAEIPSRTERWGVLRGTKHTVARERQVFVTRGREDGRTIVIVPETKDNHTTGITLLHVRFVERLSPAAARSVLEGYRDRYDPLVDAVTETEPTFREDRLAEIPTVDLLVLPIRDLADRFRTSSPNRRFGDEL